MATKRNFSEMEPQPDQGRGAAKGDIDNSRPQKKQRLKHKAKEGTLNWTKKRIRTIERCLHRDGHLPDHVRRELERELDSHRQTVDRAAEEKKRKDMIRRYHMIRFFERQKASRLVKQLEEKLKTATDPEEKARLQADLHIARVDVNYAKYHPFMEKYVSLYPKTKDKQNEEGSGAAETAGNGAGSKQKPSSGSSAARHLHDERPPLWKEVEQAMMEGEEALLRLQERRPNRSRTVPPAPSKAPSKEKHGGAVQKKKEASGTAREPRHVEGEEQQQEQRQARPQRPQSTTPPATTRSKGSAANAVPLNGNRAARRAALRKKFYEDGLRPGYGDDKGTSGDDSDFFED